MQDQETQVLLLPINTVTRKSDISEKNTKIFLKHETVIATKETYTNNTDYKLYQFALTGITK